jgi:hypothetical protein
MHTVQFRSIHHPYAIENFDFVTLAGVTMA